jgi:hypothetical protein
MLQNPLHVAHTSALSGPTQKVTKVRISISPPHSLSRREIRLHYCKNRSKSPQSCRSCSQTALEKVSSRTPKASFLALFSGGHTHSPLSAAPSGECNAITNRSCGESVLTKGSGSVIENSVRLRAGCPVKPDVRPTISKPGVMRLGAPRTKGARLAGSPGPGSYAP